MSYHKLYTISHLTDKTSVLGDLFFISMCMVFRECSGAISYCVMYKYTYTNIIILNNTMSFTFIYVENLITWMVSNQVLVIYNGSPPQHLHYWE